MITFLLIVLSILSLFLFNSSLSFWELSFILWYIGTGLLYGTRGSYEEVSKDELESKCIGIVGYKGLKYLIILLNIFIWTLFQNWVGLLGYTGGTNSGMANANLTISMLVFIYITYRGFEVRGKQFLEVFIPGNVPNWIKPFMRSIETISYCSRVVSLCTRLTANVFGGHVLTGVISKFISYLGNSGGY